MLLSSRLVPHVTRCCRRWLCHLSGSSPLAAMPPAAGMPALIFIPMSRRTHELVAAAGFAFAALWQITPLKRKELQRCHRTTPLSATGWRADRDCAVFGIHYGRHCAGSCWAMMLGCALASHAVAVLACVQLIAMHERDARAPRFTAYALALMACAVIVAWPLIIDR